MSTKIIQMDLFIKEKEDVKNAVITAKSRNFSRRINHLFGELEKIKKEIEEFDPSLLEEKTP